MLSAYGIFASKEAGKSTIDSMSRLPTLGVGGADEGGGRAEKDLEATFQKVTGYKEIVSYGMMRTSGLVIDGKVVSAGRIPSKQEIAG